MQVIVKTSSIIQHNLGGLLEKWPFKQVVAKTSSIIIQHNLGGLY